MSQLGNLNTYKVTPYYKVAYGVKTFLDPCPSANYLFLTS